MGIRLGVIATISPEHSRDWVRTMPSEVSMSSAGNDREPTVEELKRELAESHRREAATAEVLKVISRSKFDLQPVLDTIARIASRLCAAENVTIFLREHTDLRLAAHHGSLLARLNTHIPVGRGFVAGRAVVNRQPIQVPDLTVAGDEFPLGREHAVKFGHRTSLGIPLLRDDAAIGCLLLRRRVVQPFDENQIALLQTFADQAVIAIENTRLFEAEQSSKRELQESLDQQTSSAKVLSVISATPGHVGPVFDTILEEATRLCEAQFGVLHRFDGSAFIPVAVRGAVRELVDRYRSGLQPTTSNALGRILRTKQPVHLADVREGPGDKAGDPAAKSIVDVGGARSYLLVPLLRDDNVVGGITIFRQEVRPFSEKQIDLLANFASQAVIAIENARLLGELRQRTDDLTEALTYQTGSS